MVFEVELSTERPGAVAVAPPKITTYQGGPQTLQNHGFLMVLVCDNLRFFMVGFG